MMLYEWPGNVRELENAIERAVVVSKGRKLIHEDLPIFRPEYQTLPADNTLLEVEKTHIRRILSENHWNVAKSAKILGIDRSTLYNKIKRHNIRKAS